MASTPTAAYTAASAKNDRSIPSAGKSRNSATGAPNIPPVVLASVIHAAARHSPSTRHLSAAPMNVKRTPERKAVGNARTLANQRMRYHSAAHGPAARNRKVPYDAAVTPAATNATTARCSNAPGRRRSIALPASPPSPIPLSTTASTKLIASVLDTTKSDRKRVQTTSSASRLAPATNAHASKRHSPGGRIAATEGITERSSSRSAWDSQSAAEATLHVRSVATQALPM